MMKLVAVLVTLLIIGAIVAGIVLTGHWGAAILFVVLSFCLFINV